jgi:hypothetical protein
MDVSSRTDARTLRGRIQHFFYQEQVPYGVALLRIVLPLVLLQTLVPRWIHAREFFSTDGAAAPLAINYSLPNFPPEPGGTLAVAMMTALIVALISACIGWLTRPSLLIACALYSYLTMLDCVSTMTKYSVISSHMLLLLSLSQCGSLWSVDAWRRQRCHHDPPGMPQLPQAFPVWPQRLIQLFIALVYFGAACTKMHTDGYFTSDQLRYWLMTNVNNRNPAGELLSFAPAIVIFMANFAIVWQIVFVFVVWKPVAKWLMLAIGIMFHASTTPLLGLYIFPQVMISSYLSYVEADHFLRVRGVLRQFWKKLQRRFEAHPMPGFPQQRQPRFQVPIGATSGVVWAAVLMMTTVAGVAAESLYDPYGMRGTEGPLELRPLDSQLVERLMAPNPPIPFSDRLLSFDVGSDMLGGVLLTTETSVRRGELFYVQASIAPPHEDAWLNCQLRGPDGQLLHESGQIVPRDRLRGDWQYTIPATSTAGRYRFVLEHEGRAIAERIIDVH